MADRAPIQPEPALRLWDLRHQSPLVTRENRQRSNHLHVIPGPLGLSNTALRDGNGNLILEIGADLGENVDKVV
jgi:hypothetical protein